MVILTINERYKANSQYENHPLIIIIGSKLDRILVCFFVVSGENLKEKRKKEKQ